MTTPPTIRTILHMDMDSFYVSVERLLNPSLHGKPVAVGGPSDGRGVISSASYEARAFGVRSAMPVSVALRLCPQLILVHSGFARYGEYSGRISRILGEFTPLVQMASQDEAYLDLTGTDRLWGNGLRAAHRIRQRIAGETRLPCSIGIATNKLIAKIASDLCKPRGMLWVPPGSEASFLAPLPITRMPGIGPASETQLLKLGVTRIGQLQERDRESLKARFGDHGAELFDRSHGRSDSPVQPEREVKSVGAEETFGRDSADHTQLDRTLAALCEKVARRMRDDGVRAGTLTLKYRFADFETHTAARPLSPESDDEVLLLRAARELLSAKWNGRPLRLIGVSASNLHRGAEQLDLLAEPEREKRRRLHEAVDSIRVQHGGSLIRHAARLDIERAAQKGKKRDEKP